MRLWFDTISQNKANCIIMLDYIGYEKTAGLVLFNIVLFIFALLCFTKAKKSPFYISSTGRKNFGIFLILIFFVFAFWGSDWFHVADFYPQLQAGNKTHMEDVYVWIAQNIAPNYIVFRIIIWGLCLFLTKLIFDRLDVSKDLLWFMFVIFGVIWCSYARVSLSMCLMFYGFSLLFNPYKHRLLSYVLGLMCICASYFFHKSALFGILVILISICVRKFNKKTIFLLVLSIPLLFYVLKSFLIEYLLIDVGSEGDMWDKSVMSAQSYMERDANAVGIGALLLKFLERSAYFLTCIISILAIIEKRKRSPIIDAFMRLDIIMVLVSSLFLFNVGINTSIISERFFRFLFIPTTILVAHFWQNNYKPRLTKTCCYLGGAYSFYALLYSIYMFL